MLMMLNLVSSRFEITLRPPPGGPIADINCIFCIYFFCWFCRSYLLERLSTLSRLIKQVLIFRCVIRILLVNSCQVEEQNSCSQEQVHFTAFLRTLWFTTSWSRSANRSVSLRTLVKLFDLPESIVDPLTDQFQWWLCSVRLFHRHVKVVHKSYHRFIADGNVNRFRAFLQSALNSFLYV